MEGLSKEDLEKEFTNDWEQDLLSQAENDFYSQTTHEIDDKDSPTREHLEVLSKSFGHNKFRPMQWKIIHSIINERRDNCAIMTTGYGKSLCYQYPSVYMGGITIVVSPLISLMEDQVLAMKVANISACLLGTANDKQAETVDKIFENKYSLVYVTPELCAGDFGRGLLKDMYEKLSITLVAIDEAHCVSFWGHDFRFKYRELGLFKQIMPNIPVLAVTATATPVVRNDIIQQLNLKDPQILCTGFDRPNLYFSVHLRSNDPLIDFRKVMKYQGGRWEFSGSTIIYCITRKATEEICDVLSGTGIKCLPYHAGLTLKVRKDAHEKFVKDKLDVIVATIAFGMGIDKPDVRHIIHYGASNSIEGYYQEVGRAGRDGLPAKCTAFYSRQDFSIHERLREISHGTAAIKAHKKKMANIMLDYLYSRDCRRQFILSYFEGNTVNASDRPSCCDNCVRKHVQPDTEVFKDIDDQGKYDFTEDAKIFLRGVNALNGKYGMIAYVSFLRGSKNSKMSRHLKNPLHGSGKHKSEDWWKGIGALLEKEKYLEKTKNTSDFTYFTINLSRKGKHFLENIGNMKLLATPTPELINFLERKTNVWLGSEATNNQQQDWLQSSTVNSQQQQPTTSTFDKSKESQESTIKLYKLLMNKRYELATSVDCMPYLIASNKALMDMAIQRPTTLLGLKNSRIEGFTEIKMTKFAEEFLKIIRLNTKIDTDPIQVPWSIENLLIEHPLASSSFSVRVSYTHFKAGLTVEEIAQRRGMIPNTIFSHLTECIKLGYPIKLVDLGVTNEIKETIINAIKSVETGMSLLTPIKNACPPDITFNQVKSVVNYLLVRQHLKKLNLPYEDFEDSHSVESIPTVTNTNIIDLTEPNSPGKLTQLLNAIDEVNETSTDISNERNENLKSSNINCAAPFVVKDEDSNFSEGFNDADLAAVCDELETSLNERDEPLLKKLKTENAFEFSVLDSPPRESDSTRQSSTTSKFISSGSKNTSESDSSNSKNIMGSSSVSSNSKNTKDKLPPWLMTKRIA